MDKQYSWKVASPVPAEQLNQFPELDPRVLQLLANRGVNTQKEIESFLLPDYQRDQHDPFLFRDMKKAVERIRRAVEQKEKVVVHGDYDADGVCGSVVLYTVLKAIGAVVEVYLPHRDTEGYGLNMNTVQSLSDVKTKLIITVDCGISNKPEVEKAVALGIGVIVTDHHSEPLELPSAALAILNPKLAAETYPFKYLAGVGVAFKVAQALITEYSLGEAFEKWLLDMVAVSTITDCVPLIGENRLYVRYGLVVLRKNRRIGLRQLLAAMGTDPTTADTETIGYRIGPHINAAGRVKHANMAFDLLIAEDEDKAVAMAQELCQTNKSRQSLSESMSREALLQAEQQKDEYVIIVESQDWPVGLVGLVAGRVASAYYRPTFVITKMGGEIVGSGRSIEHFDLVASMQSMKEVFRKYGGHPMACGFSLNDEQSFEQFKEKMRQRAKSELEGRELVKTLFIDAELSLSRVDWDLLTIVEQCAPYGEGNREPLFVARRVMIEELSFVGKQKNHLRMSVSQQGVRRPCISFNCEQWQDRFTIGQEIDIAFKVSVNEWNGHRDIQLGVRDILLSS